MKGVLHNSALGSLAHNLLRAGFAALWMQHGVQKLFGWFADASVFESGMEGFLLYQRVAAGCIETFGGLLLLLGLFTRPVAALGATMMLVAYLQVHLPRGMVPIENAGEMALLYMLAWAFIATHGPGHMSMDHVLAQKKREAVAE